MARKHEYLPVDFLTGVAEVIKMLGHPQRLHIVDVLDREGEITAGRISELCGLSQSQTSQHLAQMRRLGVVSGRREGTQVFYQIDSVQPRTIIMCLRNHYKECGGGAGGQTAAKIAVKKSG